MWLGSEDTKIPAPPFCRDQQIPVFAGIFFALFAGLEDCFL
ncbi:hypothetical protein ATPR_0164 [Acetobacter tropicalis NBRC 101654]|uniref:Uncharacterized protein n=1 Tax=Acetobacter tropicalis NBRC 101654 TaxID=749388 RepID=F7V9W5_9PROT|nr:hypothetical protein ATPR_0164 [Acetobacter tropicalis NBRC 101654]